MRIRIKMMRIYNTALIHQSIHKSSIYLACWLCESPEAPAGRPEDGGGGCSGGVQAELLVRRPRQLAAVPAEERQVVAVRPRTWTVNQSINQSFIFAFIHIRFIHQ